MGAPSRGAPLPKKEQNYQDFQGLLTKAQIAAEQYQAAQMAALCLGYLGSELVGGDGRNGVIRKDL
jgi:hypothetical protein